MFGLPTQQKNLPDFEYFTIYDTKVGIYRAPMLAINQHDMVRQLSSLFSDPAQARNELLLHAEDYQLFKIGDFTKKTGVINGHAPQHVANLHEIRTSVQLSKPSEPEAQRQVFGH